LSVQKKIPQIVLLLFVADLLLCFSYGLNFLIGEPFEQVTRLVKLDGEMNIPTWYSSMQWFCVAFLFGIFAIRNFDLSKRKSWVLLLLPLIFLVFSIDEVVCIHEWLGKKTDVLLPTCNRKDTFFRGTGIWFFVVGVPVFLGCLQVLWSMKKYFTRSLNLFRKMMIGTIIFFGGAIGVEVLSNIPGSHTFGSVLQNIFEEGTEMVGVTVLFWAAYDLLMLHGFRLHLDGATEAEASAHLLDSPSARNPHEGKKY
jgi:hypothetical protein